MKTFLRTSLFRILAAIAFLIVSGFGYNGRKFWPVFNQSYLIKRLPNQVKDQISLQGWDKGISECMQELSIQTSTESTITETADPAIIIETDGFSDITSLPATLPPEIRQSELVDTPQPNLNALQNDLTEMREEITKQFNQLYNQLTYEHSQLALLCKSSETSEITTIDLNAQKKAELQSQIEQLQAEISNL